VKPRAAARNAPRDDATSALPRDGSIIVIVSVNTASAFASAA
jgi:hypothetical protein